MVLRITDGPVDDPGETGTSTTPMADFAAGLTADSLSEVTEGPPERLLAGAAPFVSPQRLAALRAAREVVPGGVAADILEVADWLLGESVTAMVRQAIDAHAEVDREQTGAPERFRPVVVQRSSGSLMLMYHEPCRTVEWKKAGPTACVTPKCDSPDTRWTLLYAEGV